MYICVSMRTHTSLLIFLRICTVLVSHEVGAKNVFLGGASQGCGTALRRDGSFGASGEILGGQWEICWERAGLPKYSKSGLYPEAKGMWAIFLGTLKV